LAVFEVAPDPTRPFVVEAGANRVIATGTRFDVRIVGDAVVVVLLEGSVTVEPKERTLFGRRAMVQLVAGERFDGTTHSIIALDPQQMDAATAWQADWLDFENERLAEVVERINRGSAEQIRLEGTATRELRVSGRFKAGAAARFAAAAVVAYPVEKIASGEAGVIVLGSRQPAAPGQKRPANEPAAP
jgi:transmembrane sensor